MASPIVPSRRRAAASALLTLIAGLTLACVPITQDSSGGSGAILQPPGGDVVNLPPGDLRAIAVNFAVQQNGKPYTQWPNNPALSCGRGSATCTRIGPDCFDCSGLTQTAYKQAGVTIGPTTYYQINDGVSVPCTAADLAGAATTCWQPGDLALFLDRGDPYHVAMYVGAGMFIEALNCGEGVLYWQRTPSTLSSIMVRRIIDTDGRTVLGGA